MKAEYKPFLDRLAYNLNTLITNKNKTSISNENPMTRDRISKTLMNEDEESATITMKEHAAMINAQHAYLLSVVETTRRQLVTHSTAISNLAEKTIYQR